MTTRVRTLHLLALAVVLAVLLPAGAASAAVPGANGRIAYAVDGDIWSVAADGSDVRRLTADAAYEERPSWSPDGRSIAFARGGDVYVMDADGANARLLVAEASQPAWAPDGRSVAVVRAGSIVLVSPSGVVGRTVTEGAFPAWSPDGTRLAFTRSTQWGSPNQDLRTIRTDGTDERLLVAAEWFGFRSLSWSPDGTRIAYVPTSYKGSAVHARIVPAAGGATQDLGEAADVVWSPDGTALARSVPEVRARPANPAPGIHRVDPATGAESRLLALSPETTGMDWQRVEPEPGTLAQAQGLRLDRRVYRPGDTITGTVRWTNPGGMSVRVRQAVITVRRPGATNLSGPWDDLFPRVLGPDVAPGAMLPQRASLKLPASAPTGGWYGFATWQDAAGAWHDGPSVPFRVHGRPR